MKEVIAPLVQNLVDDVQIHTKRFKSLSRHTEPCLICANSYKVAPLPTRVSATVELEDRPVSEFLQKPPRVYLNPLMNETAAETGTDAGFDSSSVSPFPSPSEP
jgi:hypothetical protein